MGLREWIAVVAALAIVALFFGPQIMQHFS